MKIVNVEAFPVALPLKKPFTIALGTMTHSPHVVVKMTTDNGIVGYGEASTWHVVYGYDQHELTRVIDRYLGPAVVGHSCSGPALHAHPRGALLHAGYRSCGRRPRAPFTL